MAGAPGVSPPLPPVKLPPDRDLQRLRRQLARPGGRQPLRIVVAGDPRRPLRSLAVPAAAPLVAVVVVAAVLLAAVLLAATSYLQRRSLGELETRVSAMAEAADHLAQHRLPDHLSSPYEPAAADDLPRRAVVKAQRAVPADRLGHFEVESVNNGERVEVILDLGTGETEERSYRALRRQMRCLRTGAETPIDPRLIELLHAIAKRTGQKIHLVSGFRAPMFSTAALSYHTRGMAADIRIPGMTALMVRDLVLSMGVKGVGYYPVSQFVHIDVRDQKAYWVDSGAAREETESVSHGE
jgi:uncharacterized protein YcbK (DUF882 family)